MYKQQLCMNSKLCMKSKFYHRIQKPCLGVYFVMYSFIPRSHVYSVMYSFIPRAHRLLQTRFFVAHAE